MAKFEFKEVIEIKKLRIVVNLVVLTLILVSLSIFVRKKENEDEFEIFQSFIVEGGDGRRTRLNVIVNVSEYDINEMCDEIKERHDKLNGEADELLIRLYNGREDFKEHKCAGEGV